MKIVLTLLFALKSQQSFACLYVYVVNPYNVIINRFNTDSA